MTDLIQTTFDYAALAPETAIELRMAAERIRLRMKRAAEDIIAIGQELIAAKGRLPHGQFLAWLATEFEMSGPTALRFMQVAERFSDKNVILTNLSPSILYLLAAPSTPESIIGQVASGEVDRTTAAVKEAIAAAKAEAEAARHETAQWQRQAREYEQVAEDTQSRVNALTHSIRALQEELTEKDRMLTQVKEIEVVPSKDQEARIALLESQRKDLANRLAESQHQQEKLAAHARDLESIAAGKRDQSWEEEQGGRILARWITTSTESIGALRKIVGQLPSAVDCQHFDAEAWQRWEEMFGLVRQAASALESLRQPLMIDAS